MKNDFYFMELKKLNAEITGEAPSPTATLAKSWMPAAKKIVAAFKGRTDKKNGWYDYVALTDDIIYFCLIIDGPEGPALRSIKGFKASDIVAFAFMLEMDEGLQLRLMMSEGKRIKLCLKDTPENRDALKAISHSKFFAGK